MLDRRRYGEDHINKVFKQINPNTWLVGNILMRRIEPGFPMHEFHNTIWIDEEDGSSYSLQETNPALYSTEAVNSPYIPFIHEAGDASAVWAIGSNTICKIKYIEHGATAESDTLTFVQSQRPSFETPKIIKQTYYDDRSYLFLQRIPGRTLDAVWPTLTTEWRHRYVAEVVRIIKEMAEWKGSKIGGFDGRAVPQWYLLKRNLGDLDPADLDPAELERTCLSVGMDCTDLVFQHCDLGPTNIIVEQNPQLGYVGLIDFETAGYFPRDWIRTKCLVCSRMDLTCWEPSYRWRVDLEKVLKIHGFRELGQAWMDWFQS